MTKYNVVIFLFFFFMSSSSVFCQAKDVDNYRKNWFVSLDYGSQMSGIKSEDFINSNYSPVIRISFGKWLNSSIAIQVGYQGFYFNAIADKDQHFYDFYFAEAVFDIKNILLKKRNHRFHELLFHVGFGFFQNHYYNDDSIHSVLGVSNNFLVSKRVKIKFDIGAIAGWDIYQGNSDILPSLSLGIIFNFHKA